MKGLVGDVMLTGEPLTLTPSVESGKYTASYPDGQVLSMQPNGSKEKRPHDTDGPYERCTPSGNLLVYAYQANGHYYAHALQWLDASTINFS